MHTFEHAQDGARGTWHAWHVPHEVGCYTTKALSTETWGDFEDLFSRGNGWDFCRCMVFHRGGHVSKVAYPTRADMAERNRQEKRSLVEGGSSHGILVYRGGRVVGWCQYGPRDELPGPDLSRRLGKGHRPPEGRVADLPLWRITCFVVDKAHRNRRVASVALHAALEAIQAEGGGLVEAFPMTGGRPSLAHGGYLPMFERESFDVIEHLDNGSTLVRRVI